MEIEIVHQHKCGRRGPDVKEAVQWGKEPEGERVSGRGGGVNSVITQPADFGGANFHVMGIAQQTPPPQRANNKASPGGENALVSRNWRSGLVLSTQQQ